MRDNFAASIRLYKSGLEICSSIATLPISNSVVSLRPSRI